MPGRTIAVQRSVELKRLVGDYYREMHCRQSDISGLNQVQRLNNYFTTLMLQANKIKAAIFTQVLRLPDKALSMSEIHI